MWLLPSTQSPGTRERRATWDLAPAYLRGSVRKPVSPYDVKTATIIPGEMLAAITSDLPGQITGQVRANVYDSDTGEHLLIPRGMRGAVRPPPSPTTTSFTAISES